LIKRDMERIWTPTPIVELEVRMRKWKEKKREKRKMKRKKPKNNLWLGVPEQRISSKKTY
jgi:hypothetical protein